MAARKATSEGQRNPGRTREAILRTAIREFSDKGLSGARVDEIARRSGANKRMIYHYFGGKEALYLAALERTYEKIRTAERGLRLEDKDPEEGMRELVRFSFNYFRANPEFVQLLNTENLHGARFLKQSKMIRDLHTPLTTLIARLIERGHAAGVFRGDVDPVQLYVSVAALGYFYFSNQATLSTIFARDLMDQRSLADREAHCIDVIMRYLRP
ncbi:MAG: TetR family transcriptional regulator [Hyphomicrobiales bacterium]|nr:TetR family transcriptional regulator [Hyphomicrobiales bacterium]MCP5374327.1 TetR family transcriptional regulator [Hyphomicrobiales bacterium]